MRIDEFFLLSSRILLIIGIIIMATSIFFIKIEKRTGDCYDRYGSKIIGQQCEIYENTGSMGLIILGATICGVCFVTMILSVIIEVFFYD